MNTGVATLPMGGLDLDGIQGADAKKRNKLGYHRTAVACGHCRRRKIRCIPSPDTSSTRCQNCIRLKKDCHFYPVDQNSQSGKKGRSDSRADDSGDDNDLSTGSASDRNSFSVANEAYDESEVSSLRNIPGPRHRGHSTETIPMLSSPQSTNDMMFAPNSNYFASPNSEQDLQSSIAWTTSATADGSPYATHHLGAGYAPTEVTSLNGNTPYGFPNNFPGSRQQFVRHGVDEEATSGVDMMSSMQAQYRSSTYPALDRRPRMSPNAYDRSNAQGLGLPMGIPNGISPPSYGYGSVPVHSQIQAMGEMQPDQIWFPQQYQQPVNFQPYLASQRASQSRHSANAG